MYKKPGPKPKPKLTAASQLTTPTIKSIQDSTPTTSKEAERVKRKYVRKSVQLEPLQDEPSTAPAASDDADDHQNNKRKSHDPNQNAASEVVHKKIKSTKFNDSNEQSTSKIYLENYNKVLQERNDVLLEILEQRSAEIRSLKMRVSNMTKSDDESKFVEKKDNIEESWSPAELSKAYSLQKLSKSNLIRSFDSK